MKLYYNPVSSYCQKVLMAFHEKEAPFEPEIVDLSSEKARKKYQDDIYPIGKVPLLILDDGRFIPESSIIIEYLDTYFDSGPQLIPEDKEEGRKVRFRDRMIDLYLMDSIVSLLFEEWKPPDQRDPELIEKMQHRAAVMYGYMEHDLEDKTWISGDEFTLADCAATPALFYAHTIFGFDDCKNLCAYWERLSNRESWKKVYAEAAPALERLTAATET